MLKTPVTTEWTIATLVAYFDEQRAAEERFALERDRRYSELNIERERALKIKEDADTRALQLAREIQTYKDEKANELREQINSERGHYATKEDVQAMADKFEVALKPIQEYIAADRGKGVGLSMGGSILLAVVALISTLLTIGTFIFKSSNTPTAPPQVIMVPAPQGTMLPTTPPSTVPR